MSVVEGLTNPRVDKEDGALALYFSNIYGSQIPFGGGGGGERNFVKMQTLIGQIRSGT